MPTHLKGSMPSSANARPLRRFLPISLAVALTLSFGTADAWAKGNSSSRTAETPVAPETSTPSRAPAPDPAFDDTYAEREASAAGLEAFEGGDVVIIGSTGLVILLLVILIILIL